MIVFASCERWKSQVCQIFQWAFSMTSPACLLALLPPVGPGSGLDHLCLCLSHIPCGFMCCHINMEQQRWIDIFLAAGRSRSSNQKTDFQSKAFVSSSWPRIWTLLSCYICISAHESVHASDVHEVTYTHAMSVHSVCFPGKILQWGIQLNVTTYACNSLKGRLKVGWKSGPGCRWFESQHCTAMSVPLPSVGDALTAIWACFIPCGAQV